MKKLFPFFCLCLGLFARHELCAQIVNAGNDTLVCKNAILVLGGSPRLAVELLLFIIPGPLQADWIMILLQTPIWALLALSIILL